MTYLQHIANALRHGAHRLMLLLPCAVACLTLSVAFASCRREPDLYLHTHGSKRIEGSFPKVHLDLNVFWQYDIYYDWQAEWTYGWDDEDRRVFRTELGYSEPEYFHLYRYFLGNQQSARHTQPREFEYIGTSLTTDYEFGYYDLLARNEIMTPDGVQSILVDDYTTYDSVMVFTNQTLASAHYNAPAYNRAFHQPEELFAAYHRNLHITDNLEDYDHYDPETNTYHMYIDMTLLPVTYIYLTQVRLHNNRGRIENVSGEANLSGMARGACLNTGKANKDAITVHYNTRLKKDCRIRDTGELVDIAGGRCLTFGMPNHNSSRLTRAEDVSDEHRHYMDMNFVFNNGMDSTIVFDITDQVRRRYRGGVITIDLNVDTIPIPSRSGGSGFDAVVKDFEEETHEFEM